MVAAGVPEVVTAAAAEAAAGWEAEGWAMAAPKARVAAAAAEAAAGTRVMAAREGSAERAVAPRVAVMAQVKAAAV